MKNIIMIIIAAMVLFAGTVLGVAEEAYTPDPATDYAKSFIQMCEGQDWFIQEVERILNTEQKTLDFIEGPEDLKNIKSLGFKDQGVTGKIPSAIGELTELRYLFLSGNHLSGPIPEGLYSLAKLQNIDLTGNDYSGAIPVGFGSMEALTHLSLRNNSFTGGIPEDILANRKIVFLDVSGNHLSGGIPAELSNMTSLEYLSVSDNDWTKGELPDLSGATSLITLSAWKCQLIGELPGWLYSLKGLQILDLDTNGLSGEISGSISQLKELQLLALSNNELSGTVPVQIGDLAKLTVLDIAKNRLRGTLPESVKNYDEVYAEGNYMTGEVLREMEHNEGNFTDGAGTPQYQLSCSRTTVNVSADKSTDLYALLENKPVGSAEKKALLPPEDYSVEFDPEKLDVIVDDKGIHVRALTEISAEDAVEVVIQIKDNDGSDYSRVRFLVTTEAAPSGGGVSGGGEAPAPANTHKLYVNGFPDGNFYPQRNVSREQTAKMLVDALEKEKEFTGAGYTDVDSDRWSYEWIMTAAENQYFEGYPDGRFLPEAPIKRGEMAAVLVRIAETEELELKGEEKTFLDVEEGKWYAMYVEKATGLGLINGYEDGTFRPEANITRTEAVAMINRMLSRNYDTAVELHRKECPFPDVTEDYWGYGDIMEASLTHAH